VSRVKVKDKTLYELFAMLQKVLRGHVAKYEEICDLLKRQRDRLMENDPDGLEKLVRIQQDRVLDVASTEEKRKLIQEEITDRLNIQNTEDASIGDLMDAANITGSLRRSLDEVREEMIQLTETARDLNRQNNELIKQSLKFVSYSINEIQKMAGSGGTYGREGRAGKDNDSVLMDRKY